MTRGKIVKAIAREVLGVKGVEVWSRLELIGDIAVIKKPIRTTLTLEDFRALGEALTRRIPGVKSVWLAVSPVAGPYKTRSYVHLAGEERVLTIYREHGCSFKVDITRVFVTPRLSYEHLRVASIVSYGEVVVNMFAGAGIFSIVIARVSKPRAVHSIDINVDAYNLMVENVKINGLEGVVIPHLGDAAKVVEERLVGVADRVLMPLPDLALDYAPYALKALKGSRGFIHFYIHINVDKRREFLERAVNIVKSRVESLGWSLSNASSRVVRNVGPRLAQVVVDATVEKA